MFVECCCFSKFRYRATLGATAALALIATGVILYSAFDLQFSRLGTLFIVTNTVLVVAETLYKRRLLIDDADPLHLSKQAMMLMNAVVGLPIVGITALFLTRGLYGDQLTLAELIPTFDTGEWLYDGTRLGQGARRSEPQSSPRALLPSRYIVGSGVLMTLFNLSGLRLTQLISATSITVVTNAAKGECPHDAGEAGAPASPPARLRCRSRPLVRLPAQAA